jgi:hypothetical protein
MIPSIKTIVSVGLLALLIFGILGFIYNYTKAGELDSALKTGLGNYYNIIKSNMPSQTAVAAGQFYIWIATSCFTKLNSDIDKLIGLANSISTAAKQYGINIDVAKIASALIPNKIFYYILAIVSGFIAGIFFLKKESKFIDAAFSPIIPAIVFTILFVVVSIMLLPMLQKQNTSAEISSFLPAISFGFFDYVMIFIITYTFIFIGTISAASAWHFAQHKQHTISTQVQKSAFQQKSKKVKKIKNTKINYNRVNQK